MIENQTPFRVDDPDFKFKYFWWWFNKDKSFIPMPLQQPLDETYVEIIYVDEKDGLPCNHNVYHRKNMFISISDMDKDFITDVPRPIRGATHWRYS